MDDATLLARFEAAELTPADWDHRAHVRVAWLYVARGGPDEARGPMRRGLRGLLAAFGIEDTPEGGYHETITAAWLRLVAATARHHGGQADSTAFCDAHPHLMQKTLLRLYYTRARLLSAEAKGDFVAPDIAPLP